MSGRDKWVRRFSVDETAKHKNGFTIYKITSVLFPIESPEAMTIVSVWKRYSDVQRLHKTMKSLHTGLHLRGTFPPLANSSFFKRFHQQVIEERAKTIKTLLEFVAEHRLLFTSTDFVSFLQNGYPEPVKEVGGVIDAIRSSLRLPPAEEPPLERAGRATPTAAVDNDDIESISQIPIYKAADVEIRQSPVREQKISKTDSFDSINSLDSINSDLYDELNKFTIDKVMKPSVKKTVLPDLINFDEPSTSFDDYHTMVKKSSNADSESVSLTSSIYDPLPVDRSTSRLSLSSKKSMMSLSNLEMKTKTEDSYVFEAGYMFNLAARCEDMGDYQRAFECYKSGIEKMLIGVQTDTDPQRRALIKDKTNKYLSYAEAIYRDHLQSNVQNPCEDLSGGAAGGEAARASGTAVCLSQLRAVRAGRGGGPLLVLHALTHAYYAVKVVQKVPNNLTEFDEYFLQRTSETRQPILPNNVPYMVPLHSYIETTNLIFLILSYAPGERLFDYIKNYTKSTPATPNRQVNLENVFTDPRLKNIDIDNNIDNSDKPSEANMNNNPNDNMDSTDNIHISTNDLVINSQKLLLNVDKALNDIPMIDDVDEEDGVMEEKETERVVVERKETPSFIRSPPAREAREAREALPASALRRWAAEILTAVEGLHSCGVICRDLNPSNILLGKHGQIILTYFIYYPGIDMCLSKLRSRTRNGAVDVYMAPELYRDTYVGSGRGELLERAGDYWSFGAVMYELLCGVPLSQYHRSIFTEHTLLYLPEGLTIEEQSLLTQLLTYNPEERLGAGADGIEEIKRHPYFRNIDWQQIIESWIAPD